MSLDEGVERIRRLGRRTERRIRFGRMLKVVADGLCAALILAIVDVALRKVGVVGERGARGVLAAAAGSVLAAGVGAWMWRLPERAGARALDRFHTLHDRLASALAFAALPDPGQTPFMRAAIEDAIGVAANASPRRAVRIVLPRTLGVATGLLTALVAVSLFEVRRHQVVAHARTIDSIELAPDDLDDVKDFLKKVEQNQASDETKAAVEEFNKLVDDIASQRLDRTEAFRRMEALEAKFLTGSAADRKALERQLEVMGEELKKAELTRPAGLALTDDDLAKASAALRELAKKMRAPDAPVDKAKLDQLREALKEAVAQAEKNEAERARRREQLADDILKQKQRMGDGGSDEERSLLEKKQQELDRLDRETAEQKNGSRDLDRLDRELEQAAQDLMKDLGQSADDLEQSAEDLNHLEQEQMTQEQKEQLRQKLQEMRQLLRQQGQNGKAQIVRLKRFGQMARGHGQSGGGQGTGGEDGQNPSDGQGGPPQNGGSGQQGSQGQAQGQGGGGSQAGQAGETWIVGPGGEKVLLLSKGAGNSPGQPGGAGESGGAGGPGAPNTWGEGHDPAVQGQATHSRMGNQDTQVQGADTGQGGSRSQVIQGAAERGFASHNYRKVYTEYHQVAEESLTKDEIPGGYRFFVKRYFQLIRPREEP